MNTTKKWTVVAIEEGCFIAVAVVVIVVIVVAVVAIAADSAGDHFVFVTEANTKPHWQKKWQQKLNCYSKITICTKKLRLFVIKTKVLI